MPTYLYKCSNCQKFLEKFQKITADPITTCPNCQKETLQRQIGGKNAIFHFEGDGFYYTDYKRNEKCNLCKDPKSCMKKEKNK